MENIQNIIFNFISKDNVDNTRVILNERYEGVTWIPGTRPFHEFITIDQYSVEMKRTSEDKETQNQTNKILLFMYYTNFFYKHTSETTSQ